MLHCLTTVHTLQKCPPISLLSSRHQSVIAVELLECLHPHAGVDETLALWLVLHKHDTNSIHASGMGSSVTRTIVSCPSHLSNIRKMWNSAECKFPYAALVMHMLYMQLKGILCWWHHFWFRTLLKHEYDPAGNILWIHIVYPIKSTDKCFCFLVCGWNQIALTQTNNKLVMFQEHVCRSICVVTYEWSGATFC